MLLLSIAFDHKQNEVVECHFDIRLETVPFNRTVQTRNIDDIRQTINEARTTRLKVSIAGIRHSQGGQSYVTDGIVLDMTGYCRGLNINPSTRIMTVEGGASWEHVQVAANQVNLAVEVMQSSNIFTIGGSLSVNAHGRDPHYGSMVNSTIAFRLLTYDGIIKNVSREENPQLFQLVIGGYGLFGVILDVDIHLTENAFYEKRVHTINWHDYPRYFLSNIKSNPKIGLHFTWPSIDPKNLFDEIFVADFYTMNNTEKRRSKVDKLLYKEKFITLNRFALGVSRRTKWGKQLRWKLQKIASSRSAAQYISRNNAMRPEVLFLEHHSLKDTDLLQEYYFPIEHYEEFFNGLRENIKRDDINLLSITIRFVPSANEPFLRYARDSNDSFAVVLYFNQKLNDIYRKRVIGWTHRMIELVLRLGGTYYLPYQRYPTRKQLIQAYPQIEQFFKLKLHYDPDSLFETDWYNAYKY